MSIRSKLARSSFALGIALVCGVVLAPPRARACGCELSGPDASYDEAAVVFTGTCEKVTTMMGNPSEVGLEGSERIVTGTVTRFAVEEYFKGRGAETIELRGGITSCDVNFVEGKRYLVFAVTRDGDGALTAHKCLHTAEVGPFVSADLDYARHRAAGERPSMLFGFVTRTSAEAGGRVGAGPLPGLRVAVDGAGRRVELTTDDAGYFAAFDLPAGTYTVSIGAAGGVRGAEPRQVELRAGGVTSAWFRTTTMGSLRGRLVDAHGKPVDGVQVYALRPGEEMSANARSAYETTDESGRFVFDEVPAGSYVLAVNPDGLRSLFIGAWRAAYFPDAPTPDAAKPVAVENGKATDAGDFVLTRRYPTVTLRGVVVGPNGKPFANAYIWVSAEGDAVRSVRSAADGTFALELFEGQTYGVSAGADVPGALSLESDRVVVTGAADAPVTFVALKSSPTR